MSITQKLFWLILGAFAALWWLEQDKPRGRGRRPGATTRWTPRPKTDTGGCAKPDRGCA